MNSNAKAHKWPYSSRVNRNNPLLRTLLAGILLPFGFAPFHVPGLAILGLAMFYSILNQQTFKRKVINGFVFGLGFFGFGVTWIYVSIHEYGHIHPIVSGCITLLFVGYLSLFTSLFAFLYTRLSIQRTPFVSGALFAALWCLVEFARATFLGGFPWLLIGTGQIDSPLRYLFPYLGVYGVGLLTCFSATCLANGIQAMGFRRPLWITACVATLLAPLLLNTNTPQETAESGISVGVIQANLSMRDKWDEALFWQLLARYQDSADKLMGKKELIVMPESAIPLPASYVSEFLEALEVQAKLAKTAVLLGIPESTSDDQTFYNTMGAFGTASGTYMKQHLVPFGEFIPKPFQRILDWFELPATNLKPGKANQSLIVVNHHPIAALICYELAYPSLLRSQLPEAEWIVSISDDGWFGHSLAMYQQLQIAQTLALETARYHIVANNDGLSSVIDTQGNIVKSLPAFMAGTLEATVYPATAVTFWVLWGDTPILLFLTLLVGLAYLKPLRERKPNPIPTPS